MGMECVQGRSESLAVFLARIRPGDRCTCCGAVLQPLDPGPRVARGAGDPSAVHPTRAVICPECGCEVWEESAADAEENLKKLSPAA